MDEKQRQMCFEEISLLRKVRHECVAQLVDFLWATKASRRRCGRSLVLRGHVELLDRPEVLSWRRGAA